MNLANSTPPRPHQRHPAVHGGLLGPPPTTSAAMLTTLNFATLLCKSGRQGGCCCWVGGRPPPAPLPAWHYFYRNFTELSGIREEVGMRLAPRLTFVPAG